MTRSRDLQVAARVRSVRGWNIRWPETINIRVRERSLNLYSLIMNEMPEREVINIRVRDRSLNIMIYSRIMNEKAEREIINIHDK